MYHQQRSYRKERSSDAHLQRASKRYAGVVAALFLATAAPALADRAVFKDVPVAPLSVPDASPSRFLLAGNPKVKPQAFNYLNKASAYEMTEWYLQHLPADGWTIDQQKPNYPVRGATSIIAERPGEALTAIIEPRGSGCRVALIKLNSAK